jgi:hypothetical protein
VSSLYWTAIQGTSSYANHYRLHTEPHGKLQAHSKFCFTSKLIHIMLSLLFLTFKRQNIYNTSNVTLHQQQQQQLYELRLVTCSKSELLLKLWISYKFGKTPLTGYQPYARPLTRQDSTLQKYESKIPMYVLICFKEWSGLELRTWTGTVQSIYLSSSQLM